MKMSPVGIVVLVLAIALLVIGIIGYSAMRGQEEALMRRLAADGHQRAGRGDQARTESES